MRKVISMKKPFHINLNRMNDNEGNLILNDVLQILKDTDPSDDKKIYEEHDLHEKTEEELNLSYRDTQIILDKLFADKLINRKDSKRGNPPIEIHGYYITYDGIFFLKKGGYIFKQRRDLLDTWFKRSQVIIAIIVSVVTIIYMVSTMFPKSHGHYYFYHYHSFYRW